MQRAAANVVLFLLIIPATYVAIMLAIDSDPQLKDFLWYFAFTAPVLPLVVLFVPVMSAVAFAARRLGWSQRATMTVVTAIVLAISGALLYKNVSVLVICGLGGALYGGLFRVPPDPSRAASSASHT
jgi:hypothetical protein